MLYPKGFKEAWQQSENNTKDFLSPELNTRLSVRLLQLSEGFQHVPLFISDVPHKAEKKICSLGEQYSRVNARQSGPRISEMKKKACEENKQTKRERQTDRESERERSRVSKKHFSAQGPVKSGCHGSMLPMTQLSAVDGLSVATVSTHFPHTCTPRVCVRERECQCERDTAQE